MITHVNKDQYLNIIKSEGIVIVDFWAPWCGPCRMLGQVLEEINNKYPNINIAKVNVDEEEELAQIYNINAIPHLFVFKDGVQVKDILGYTSEAQILEGLI